MHAVIGALLLLATPLPTQDPVSPTVQSQPLPQPTFALVHTNDTRGYLEACG